MSLPLLYKITLLTLEFRNHLHAKCKIIVTPNTVNIFKIVYFYVSTRVHHILVPKRIEINDFENACCVRSYYFFVFKL